MTGSTRLPQAFGRQAAQKRPSTQVYRQSHASSDLCEAAQPWIRLVRQTCCTSGSKQVWELSLPSTFVFHHAGLQALHEGDLPAAHRKVEALEPSRFQGQWYEELRLRLQLASWDAPSGDESQRAHLLEQLRLAAGVDFDEFEVLNLTEAVVYANDLLLPAIMLLHRSSCRGSMHIKSAWPCRLHIACSLHRLPMVTMPQQSATRSRRCRAGCCPSRSAATRSWISRSPSALREGRPQPASRQT